MRIGVTSQNFRTITGHGGKARRALVYAPQADGKLAEVARIDLPKEMSMHEYHGTDHPFYGLDVLITGSCGEGFRRRLASRGVQVYATGESDPLRAADAVLAGQPLPPPGPHEHHH